MKKLALISLVLLILVANTALSEETTGGTWKLTYYVDEFRTPTEEPYVCNANPIEGIFSNDIITDGKLGANILLDEKGLFIQLYEYGNSLVKNTSSRDIDYSIIMRDTVGNKTNLQGTMAAGTDRIVFDADDVETVVETLKSNPTVAFYIENTDNSANNCLFTIEDTSGFPEIIEVMIGTINEREYLEAVALWNSANYKNALDVFATLGDYKDSAEWDGKYRAMMYEKAEELLAAQKYPAANDAFIEASYFSDAAQRVGEPYYKQAEMLLEAGKYEAANQAFIDAGNYSDAEQRVGEPFYRQAETMREKQDWDGAVTAFNKAGSYGDALTQVNETYYQQADTLKTAGQYDEAYNLYVMIKGYKDVDSILENDDNIVAAAWRARLYVGNIVTFGSYNQDGNNSNGAEAIEWIVLTNDGDKAMLISKYGLDPKPYDTVTNNRVTWESCTIRKWLNNNFLSIAFTAEEQAKLDTVTVTADKNPKCSTNPGNNTQDKVFLLSIDEVKRYFTSNNARLCMPTKTALANGVGTDKNGTCCWWLRSPGYDNTFAALVVVDGSVYYYGDRAYLFYPAVRPVVVLRYS